MFNMIMKRSSYIIGIHYIVTWDMHVMALALENLKMMLMISVFYSLGNNESEESFMLRHCSKYSTDFQVTTYRH